MNTASAAPQRSDTANAPSSSQTRITRDTTPRSLLEAPAQRFPDWLRPVVLMTTLFTGFAGLAYEVIWHRYLANLLGSQARAVSIILAVFLGGLCAGYYLFGSISRRRSRRTLLLYCGLSEIGIGIWAFLFPTIYQYMWGHMGTLGNIESPIATWFFDIGVSALLLGVPTILMGGTLPLLTQGLSLSLRDSARFHALVYSVNTFGAFLGCLVSGFLLLPLVGPQSSMMWLGVGNVFAGILLSALCFAVGTESSSTPLTVDVEMRPRSLTLTRGCWLAWLNGFLSISLQTLCVRMVGLSVGSSDYSFSIVVSVFVCMLACGAYMAVDRARLAWNQWAVVLGCLGLYVAFPVWPYGAHVIRTFFSDESASFFVFYGAIFLVCALVLAIPVGAVGRTMPILFASVRDDLGKLGSNVGSLYGWNTAGCVVGALVSGHLLLYWVDLADIARLCVFTSCLLLATSVRPWILALAPAALASVLPTWPREPFAIGSSRYRYVRESTFQGPTAFYQDIRADRTLLAYKDDPNATLAVIERQPSRSLWINGLSQGATVGTDLRTTRFLAHLPALFYKGASRNAAVIGFGTGITVGSMALHDAFDVVDAIEISPFVKELAPFFDQFNRHASTDPKVHWYLNDAYRVLSSIDKTYGVIASEPSHPWVTGVERLFAKEYYELVSRKLDPNGVYVQWVHTYAMSPRTLGIVYNTFSSSFPHIRLYHNDDDLFLLGSFEPLTVKEPEMVSEMKELGFETSADLLKIELPRPGPEVFADSGVQTLQFPRLAFAAGRDYYLNRSVELEEVFK